MLSQAQSQVFRDLCWVVIEVPKAEDIVKAMKWILTKERTEKDLDLDASVKITYISLTLCGETQCYRTFDSFEIVKVEHAEIAMFSERIDERRRKYTVIVIPRKFASPSIVLKHENEYGTHYHIIYRTGVVDNTINGWKETIVFEDDP